jgi:hypothetical protein
MVETDPKQSIIDKVSRLMVELDLDSCETLLERAQSYQRIMTMPTDGHCYGIGVPHVRDDSGQKPLCGQGRGTGFTVVSADEFEKLTRPKCGKCEKAVKKLRGEEPLINHWWDWWKERYEELIIAIFEASGQKAGQWCSTTELLPRTKYKNHEYLRVALRRLKRRGLVETKRQGKLLNVRLMCDCIREGRKGRFYVDFDAFDRKEPKPEGR